MVLATQETDNQPHSHSHPVVQKGTKHDQNQARLLVYLRVHACLRHAILQGYSAVVQCHTRSLVTAKNHAHVQRNIQTYAASGTTMYVHACSVYLPMLGYRPTLLAASCNAYLALSKPNRTLLLSLSASTSSKNANLVPPLHQRPSSMFFSWSMGSLEAEHSTARHSTA